MRENVDEGKIEIDITDDHEWVERIGKTAKEICNDPDFNRIKLNGQHRGFILESDDAGALAVLVGLSKDILMLFHLN